MIPSLHFLHLPCFECSKRYMQTKKFSGALRKRSQIRPLLSFVVHPFAFLAGEVNLGFHGCLYGDFQNPSYFVFGLIYLRRSVYVFVLTASAAPDWSYSS